jgi:hypothetical protein
MDYSAALVAIKGLENGAELASAVEGKVGAIEAKNYEVIGEKRSATQKAQAAEDALKSAAKALGIDGDVDALLDQVPTKAKEIATVNATLTTEKTALETRVTDAESKVQTFDRQGKWAEIAAKVGANPKVLERLLADLFDELKIDGDAVKVGDQPLKDFIDADENLKAFAPALFQNETPANGGGNPRKQQLPGGAPTGDKEKPDPLKRYSERNYGGLKALKKQSAAD